MSLTLILNLFFKIYGKISKMKIYGVKRKWSRFVVFFVLFFFMAVSHAILDFQVSKYFYGSDMIQKISCSCRPCRRYRSQPNGQGHDYRVQCLDVGAESNHHQIARVVVDNLLDLQSEFCCQYDILPLKCFFFLIMDNLLPSQVFPPYS